MASSWGKLGKFTAGVQGFTGMASTKTTLSYRNPLLLTQGERVYESPTIVRTGPGSSSSKSKAVVFGCTTPDDIPEG